MASKTLLVRNVRGSYVSIDTPASSEFDQTPKYSMACLLPKDDEQVAQIRKEIDALIKAQWPNAKSRKGFNLPLHDGDEKDQYAYAGMVYFNCRTMNRPGILNRMKRTATEEEIETWCYSGAYFHVQVSMYTYDKAGNRGVGVGLNHAMLLERGDRIDGRDSALNAFADVDVEDEYDDGSDIPFEEV